MTAIALTEANVKRLALDPQMRSKLPLLRDHASRINTFKNCRPCIKKKMLADVEKLAAPKIIREIAGSSKEMKELVKKFFHADKLIIYHPDTGQRMVF